MLRKLGFLGVVLGLALSVSAADGSGTISGYVRSASGVPQMGAMVEVLGSAAHTLKVFTDENGFYSAARLLPGVYSIKVSAPSFLPALRERVGLPAGGSTVVNITLATLFEAIQLAPGRGPAEEEDWKWVLRSTSNRPILRMVDDHSQVAASESGKSKHDVKGTLSFLAGSPSDGFGSASDVSTGFSVERSIFSSDTIALRGHVGYGSVSPAAVLRASYSHKMENGSEPEFALTMRNLPAPDASQCTRSRLLPSPHPTPLPWAMFWNSSSAVNCRPSNSWAGSRRFVRSDRPTCTFLRIRCSSTATPHRSPIAAWTRVLTLLPRT